MVENDAQSHIGTLKTNNGGEFTSNVFEDYLKKHGIKHHLTIPYTAQQSGVVERLNKRVMNMVEAMLYLEVVNLHF